MKTIVSKDALTRMALCACFLSALPIAQAAEPITITGFYTLGRIPTVPPSGPA